MKEVSCLNVPYYVIESGFATEPKAKSSFLSYIHMYLHCINEAVIQLK